MEVQIIMACAIYHVRHGIQLQAALLIAPVRHSGLARPSDRGEPDGNRYGSWILADLITAAQRSVSSRMYLAALSAGPPKMTADSFLR